eukprot:5738901-Amphidinium_carterae.1
MLWRYSTKGFVRGALPLLWSQLDCGCCCRPCLLRRIVLCLLLVASPSSVFSARHISSQGQLCHHFIVLDLIGGNGGRVGAKFSFAARPAPRFGPHQSQVFGWSVSCCLIIAALS